jgi:hypothetical protein
MRPRKNLLPLTLDSLLSIMVPGKRYTVPMLACMFDGGPGAITDTLQTLIATGKVNSSLNNCGRYRDSREERRNYWVSAFVRIDVAQRRFQPADMREELKSYDLMAHQRLCMTVRR